MAQILVRNIPDDVKEALRRRAAARGVSMETEVRAILEREARAGESALASEAASHGLGAVFTRLFGRIGFEDCEFQRTELDRRVVEFDAGPQR
jgi:plasmid stability protein